MIFFCGDGMLTILVTKSQLQRIIPVGICSFYLRNHTGTGFNNCTGGLFTIRTEDAGHPDFFANNSFHCCSVCAFLVEETFAFVMVMLTYRKQPAWRQGGTTMSNFNLRLLLTFSFFRTALCQYDRSTNSKLTCEGLVHI